MIDGQIRFASAKNASVIVSIIHKMSERPRNLGAITRPYSRLNIRKLEAIRHLNMYSAIFIYSVVIVPGAIHAPSLSLFVDAPAENDGPTRVHAYRPCCNRESRYCICQLPITTDS